MSKNTPLSKIREINNNINTWLEIFNMFKTRDCITEMTFLLSIDFFHGHVPFDLLKSQLLIKNDKGFLLSNLGYKIIQLNPNAHQFYKLHLNLVKFYGQK